MFVSCEVGSTSQDYVFRSVFDTTVCSLLAEIDIVRSTVQEEIAYIFPGEHGRNEEKEIIRCHKRRRQTI